MKIFLSWSGDESKAVAEALRDWLPMVINSVKPWMSTGIAKGARWSPAIAAELEETRVGIICLTRTNLRAPWLLFEAGAIAKSSANAHACTFLHRLTPADVEPPLGEFQHTEESKGDVLALVRTIHEAAASTGEQVQAPDALARAFEHLWPDLEKRLAVISGVDEEEPVRSERELLEEVLDTVRQLQRRPGQPSLPVPVPPFFVEIRQDGVLTNRVHRRRFSVHVAPMGPVIASAIVLSVNSKVVASQSFREGEPPLMTATEVDGGMFSPGEHVLVVGAVASDGRLTASTGVPIVVVD